MHTNPFSQAGMREEKPPLKLHYRLSFLPGYRKREWTLAYRSWDTKEKERLRWTPSYANSNQLNGVRGDETSLSGGEERESRTHDFPCFPWLVRILPAGLCKGDRAIRSANLGGGGEHVGVDGAPIISLGQTGKNDKHRLSLFANWLIQHFVSGVRIRAFLTHVHHGHDITSLGVTVSVEKMESAN